MAQLIRLFSALALVGALIRPAPPARAAELEEQYSVARVTARSTEVRARRGRALCKTFRKTLVAYSRAGVRLWTFSDAKRFCWRKGGGKAIIHRGPLRPRARVSANAHAMFWSYEGLSARSGGYYPWRRSPWSGHESKRTGHFKLCLSGHIGCVDHDYPWVHLFAHGDGSTHKSAGV